MEPVAGMDGGVSRSMAAGTIWMVGMRWAIRFVGLINTAILARILSPADFGLVAMAMIAVDLLVTVTDGDIEMALIRARTADASLYDSGWTMKILSGVVTCAALWIAAGPLADHFQDGRIAPAIRIAALRPLILGFENIGVAQFRRDLRFAAEFRYLVLQRVTTFVAGLALVFTLRDWRALAWTMPLSALIAVGLSFAMSQRRPRLSLRHWGELWRFSRWQMLFNSARLAGERCDPLIIARLAGFAATGLYVVGFDLALMPSREVMSPSGRALLPVYAQLARDGENLDEAFRLVLGFAAIVATSIGIGMSCVAADASLLILGDKWAPTIPYVRWLGVFGAMEGLWLMLDPVMIASGRERFLALANLAFSALTIPALIAVALLLGIQAIPAGRIVVMAVVLLFVFQRIVAWGWLTPRAILGVLWRPVLAAGAMAAALHFARLSPSEAHAISLGHDIVLGAAVYGAVLFGLWHLSGRPQGAERLVAAAVRERLRP